MSIVSLETLGTSIASTDLPQAIAAGQMLYVPNKGSVECFLNSGSVSSVMFDDIDGFLPVGVTSIVSTDPVELPMYLI
jgi:hypothetical protein